MSVFTIRPIESVDDVLPMTRALNAHEGIAVESEPLAAAVATLLSHPELGRAWGIHAGDGARVGYAIVTFGFDLEFAGRDAWLTEIWVDPEHRGHGAAAAALDLVAAETRALGAGALHLQVRSDNPARRLYERAGFAVVPRLIMTRRLR
nr:GNAT family N-acetyltransferase [Kofleriaceae bacterium]